MNDEFKDNSDQRQDKNEIDDAFGFRPEQPQGGYDSGEPAPREKFVRAKKKDVISRTLTIVLAAVLAVILFMGGYFTHLFTMRESTKVLDWAFSLIEKNYIGDDVQGTKKSVEDYLDAAGKGLASEFDPYSAFYTPRELEQIAAEAASNNSDFGLTAKYVYDRNGKPESIAVHSVIGNSPAAKSGVQAEDVYVSIAGVTVDAENLNDTFFEPQNVAQDTDVVFVFARPTYQNGAMEYVPLPAVTLQKKQYTARYLTYSTAESSIIGIGADKTETAGISVLPADTMYIKYQQFEGKSDEEFVIAMDAFKSLGKKNLILDLRNNGGGYLRICSLLSNYLITREGKKSVVMSTKRKNGKIEHQYTTQNKYGEMGFEKIVVLANDNTASASEVLIGGMRDYGTLSALIGSTTYGKGIMQETFTHPQTGYAIKLTTAWWLTPNGECIQGVGFTPEDDKKVKEDPTNYPYTPEKDAALLRAVEFLRTGV